MDNSQVIGPNEVKITQYLDLIAPTQQADVAFTFGSKWTAAAHIAAHLYLTGVVNMIVVTGGENRVTGEIEADKHLAVLLQKGVPQQNIIVENESTNTKENVCFAREYMEKPLDLDGISSMIVITKWYHSRRAIMTLKRFMPSHFRYFMNTYQLRFSRRNDWWRYEIGRRYVLKEYKVIPTYLEWGHLAEVECVNGAFV